MNNTGGGGRIRRRIKNSSGGADDDRDLLSVVLLEELLMKVFTRLPMKSLLRYRCLSRRWFYIISSDTYFFDLQSRNSNHKTPLLFGVSPSLQVRHPRLLQSTMDIQGNVLSEFPLKSRKTPANSCRFLLPTRFDLVCFKSNRGVHVCNPSTREFITLYHSSMDRGSGSYGFGYVKSTNEYKIVYLCKTSRECRVFTLGMREDSPSSYASPWAWRNIEKSPFHVYLMAQYPSAVYVDGALHWLINLNRHPDIKQSILALDLENEKFKLVPYPCNCPNVKSKIGLHKGLLLMELRGFLSISYVHDNKMDIWMLKGYHYGTPVNYEWVKEYSIDLTTLDVSSSKKKYGDLIPRDIQVNHEESISKVLIQTPIGKIFYYHQQTESFERLQCEKKRCAMFSFYMTSSRSLRYVLQRRFRFEQIIGGTHSQLPQQLANKNPPIYIVRVFAHFRDQDTNAYGGYITNLQGQFVAIEGKILDASDSIDEAEAKAILCGLQLAHGQGIHCIALVSNAKELVDAINARQKQTFPRLEEIIIKIIDLLSEFSWVEVLHDRRMSTHVNCQIVSKVLKSRTELCLRKPPKWFVRG